MHCPSCGSHYTDSATFCAKCGTKLASDNAKAKPISKEKKPGMNWCGLISAICGIFGFIGFVGAGLVGILFGIAGLVEARLRKINTGLSWIGIILSLAWWILVFWPETVMRGGH